MYLHEYQAKALLAEFGIPVAPNSVVSSMQEVEALIRGGLTEAVCKIQVHAGGRGKGGGIKVASSAQEIRDHAKNLLGMRLINNQTGPDGVIAEKLLLDSVVEFTREFYLGIIIDRKQASVSIIASREGGVEIEEVAKKSPEKILVERVPPSKKLYHFQLLRLAKALGWAGLHKEAGITLIKNLLNAFYKLDATLLEINPLVEINTGFIALDAKVNIDDNALIRQERLKSMWDPSQESISEQRAHEHDLSWVALDGNIGCMVNGAGLAMATMDLIKFWGGEPANFLDVGGSATYEKVVEGFKILFQEKNVQAVLVNIFGGIMNCEIIAKALIDVLELNAFVKPVVLRMEGTNQDGAKAMIREANLGIIVQDSLDEAAKKVCDLCRY